MKPGGRIAPMPVGRAEPKKPHIYFDGGKWWVAREGLDSHGDLPHGSDAPRPSFPEACHLAMLAAIHSGAWRA